MPKIILSGIAAGAAALTLAAAGTPERVAALPASPFSTLPGALIDA